ncbi:MAG: lysophospholipid acyltransferase family protein [Akkermansiaceae bacterium]
MLEFSDAPYRFFEAQPSAPLIWLGRRFNKHFILPGQNHRISEISIASHPGNLKDLTKKGERLMFVINHPTHSDAQVLSEVHRRLGLNSCYMAAYDVFLRSKFCAWSMQKMGNFSIDREGSDRKAMAAAIKVLTQGKTALNIFPEGNVYLTNDRLTPFLDGAAFIAIKAQAALKDIPVKVVPVSLKFTHLTAPRATITERMLQLGKDSDYSFPADSAKDPINAVLGLGQHILRNYLEEHGFSAKLPNNQSSLYQILEEFATGLVTEIEKELEITPKDSDLLVTRISKARSKIHQIRTDTSSESHPEIDGLADRAILALRIHGYLTPYLTEHPSIDRFDETVERIAEDFYSKAMPRTGPRRAMVKIHSPIDVRDFSEQKIRAALPSLTRELEKRIQAGIDELNESNDAPGAETVGQT